MPCVIQVIQKGNYKFTTENSMSTGLEIAQITEFGQKSPYF